MYVVAPVEADRLDRGHRREHAIRPDREACGAQDAREVDYVFGDHGQPFSVPPSRSFGFQQRPRSQLVEQLGQVAALQFDDVVLFIDQYQADPKNAANAERIDCGAANAFQAIEEYRARPLNGIWATAPFLHNGSVPDLVELLKPPAERPAKFYVGNWEFNPARLGFNWSSELPGTSELDTSITGNSNAGHDYGTHLSDPDRLALIEYLKTL